MPPEAAARAARTSAGLVSIRLADAAAVAGDGPRSVRGEQYTAAAGGEPAALVHEVPPLDAAVPEHRRTAAVELSGGIVRTP
ncbi:hypothetical protein DY218_06845 [Streptomyces triticagri]|uniref:Uncharacterized protein n=1 Tax=Streptomyces triticagri TaxID=2293568 RepID=A0A372MA26_9ACTN|nr:hypothetical protein [Streptomyces triticagri]RFU87450.1 hypothetical protein DY218_06845 [Streptomyces triticagri]